MIDGFNRLERRAGTGKQSFMAGGWLDYRPKQKADPQASENGIEIELFRDDVFVMGIFSYQPVFVMNDRGETVERI
jgi:hypothetical protein